MIQACLIRDSVSSFRDESSTEDWTQISGLLFDSGMFLGPGANAQQLQFVLQYNKYFCAKGAFLKIPHQLRSKLKIRKPNHYKVFRNKKTKGSNKYN